MSIEIPAALQAAVDAINAADTDAFVAAFAPNGLVDDWGRVLKGPDGVRSWADTDAIGAKAKINVLRATHNGDTIEIDFDWRSNVFNGQSKAFVTIADGLITKFRIPAE